jgi:predicted regulator of Ras-like GTPase activity (Roadblock/LC7/MglB family)
MVETSAIENVLQGIEKVKGVGGAVLVSRSGMHLGGKVPKGAHLETFSAMFAILLGAAETATSEINEKLDYVVLSLAGSRMLVINNGPKALMVLRLAEDANIMPIMEEIHKSSKKLEELL